MSALAESIYIHPSAEVHPTAVIGEGTRIWHQVHIREGARIGENCIISKDVYIDAGVVIGDRVKIQNGVSVYHGVTVEDEAFIGPHAAFTNDLTPRSFDPEWRLVPTFVRQGASIGANATIVCGVTLGPYSMVAAGSTATVDVPPFGLVIGSPARLVSYICRKGHRMTAVDAPDWHGRYRCVECNETLEITYNLTTERRQALRRA